MLVSQNLEQGYYMFPVRPGEVNYLSGTMGELRSTHFHTGLDIKTSGITGLPIYAAADGYIMRAKVSLNGYGNALYMVHPNGTITVYAHLKSFQKDIADFVYKEQYKKETFAVDLTLAKDKFTFKKGDVIALSGNSGSSSGPHLHFEIRDKNHKVLNPLKYGFDEIKDNLAPTLGKLAFVTMDKNSRINGMFGRFEFNIIEKDGTNVLEVPVTLFGNIGVEAYAYDKLDGARNKNGVLVQTLMFDYFPIFNQNIERIDFSKQRNILKHTNYKRSKEGGRRFNKYYVDDGNFLNYYETNELNGVLSIFDPLEHSIDIQLEDSYENIVQYHIPLNDAGYSKNLTQKNMYFLNKRGFDLRKNTLELVSDGKEASCFARIFMGGEEFLYSHAYKADGKYFYLWDLNAGLPDSANVCGKSLVFNFNKAIPSEQKIDYSSESFDLSLPTYGLFDTLYMRYTKTLDTFKNLEYFNFQHPDIPLRQSATLTLKPSLEYDKKRSAIYAVGSKNRLGYMGGDWKNENLVLKTRDLIKYTIATDTIPPEVTRLKTSNGLRLKIKDSMSGIHSFRAEINGKWLLMDYEPKSGVVNSDKKIPLKGKITFVIKDNAENFSRVEFSF